MHLAAPNAVLLITVAKTAHRFSAAGAVTMDIPLLFAQPRGFASAVVFQGMFVVSAPPVLLKFIEEECSSLRQLQEEIQPHEDHGNDAKIVVDTEIHSASATS